MSEESKRPSNAQSMQEALTRKFPEAQSREGAADDGMTEALSENREGAYANPAEGKDPQSKALSNEFDLAQPAEPVDPMTEALSERRKPIAPKSTGG